MSPVNLPIDEPSPAADDVGIGESLHASFFLREGLSLQAVATREGASGLGRT